MKAISSDITVPLLILLLTAQFASAPDFAELENKANQEDTEPMYELGEMYENGVGTIQNLEFPVFHIFST